MATTAYITAGLIAQDRTKSMPVAMTTYITAGLTANDIRVPTVDGVIGGAAVDGVVTPITVNVVTG